MKKGITITVLLMQLLFIITGCSSFGAADISSDKIKAFEGFSNTEYNPETDFQYFFGDLSQVSLAGDGYYMLGHNHYLYYMEKDTMQPIAACSKVDCSHNTYDCDAYIPTVSALRYYDGYLYYVINDDTVSDRTQRSVLYRRTLDSSRIEKVCNLITAQDVNISELCIHRGYLVYSVAESESKCVLYRVDLDKKKTEKVYQYKAILAELYRFIGYGDGVLFVKRCALDKEYTKFSYDLCYYDYTKNQVSVVMENNTGDYAIAEGDIYYYDDGGVYKYDIETGGRELFYAIDESVLVSYDGKYLYFNNMVSYYIDLIDKSECRLYVTDMEGNLIDTISIVPSMVYYGDSDYMFQQGLRNIEYFDKSKLGTADGGWIEVGTGSGDN